MRHAAEHVTEDLYPDSLEINGQRFAVKYRFEPGHALDGVTLVVPLALLNQLDERRGEWLVPGLLRDKITNLMKALPKGLRKHFVPVPQAVTAAMDALGTQEADLMEALSRALHRKLGVEVPAEAWTVEGLPPFLRMNYSVLGDDGKEVAGGRDLPELRKELGVAARRIFSENAATGLERSGLTSWDMDELPEQVQFIRSGQTVVGYPALVDEGKSVGVSIIDTETEAAAAMRKGLVRLFQFAVPDQVKFLARNLPGFNAMSLRYAVAADDGVKQDKGKLAERLRDELVAAICDRAFFIEADPVRDRAQFQARAARAKTRLMDVANEMCKVVTETLTVLQSAKAKLADPRLAAWPRALTEARSHLRELLPPGFIGSTPFEQLRQFPRYLRAVEGRLDKLPGNPERDADWVQQIARFKAAWVQRMESDHTRGLRDPRVEAFRWMLEELRVSLWAQQLKTPYPVSFKRLEKFWSELR
jgi:ATP-dependent helicase HrpA